METRKIGDVDVDLITDVEALAALKDAWGGLVAECADIDIFRTHEWALTWWRHFGADARLRVLVARAGGRVLGIAPMMIRRERFRGMPVRMLTFFANRHVSRSGFVVPEEHLSVLDAFAAFWRADSREWDVLALRDMDARAPALDRLPAALRRAGLRPGPAEPSHALYFIEVEGDFARYTRARGRNFFRNIAKARRRLGEAGAVAFEVMDRPEDARASVERLFALGGVSPKEARPGVALGEEGLAFFRDLAAAFAASHGYETRFLKVGESDVSGIFSLRLAGTLYPMVTYFDPRHARLSPGRLVLAHLVEDFWNSGAGGRIDLNSSGDNIAPWATGAAPFATIYACNRRPYSTLISALRAAKRLFGGAASDA